MHKPPKKFTVIRQAACAPKSHILTLIETWLTSDIPDSGTHSPEYNTIGQDLGRRHTEVVSTYHENSLPFAIIEVPSSTTAHSLWLVLFSRFQKLLLGINYRLSFCSPLHSG